MSELQYQYPEEAIVPGLDPQQSLTKFTWEGAADRYPEGIPDKVRKAILDTSSS
jgi:error-prone DNA polymerase